ncbi:tryptophan synthase subunit alpha [Methylobacterium oryzae CBMB20]
MSITGVTGTATPDFGKVSEAVARIRRHTDLPVVVGFGVKTGAHAAAIAKGADGVVVGSALRGRAGALPRRRWAGRRPGACRAVTELVRELAEGVRSAGVGRAA